jgi:hypothetical protein
VKLERNKQSGRLRFRCENNIKTDVREIVRETMDWMNKAQDSDKLGSVDNKSLIDSGFHNRRGNA